MSSNLELIKNNKTDVCKVGLREAIKEIGTCFFIQEEDFNRLLVTKKSKAPKIGSIRNDKVNYDKEEQFFSKEDIPQQAKTIKEEIKQLIDPDHLGLRKKQWNTSVSVPKNF